MAQNQKGVRLVRTEKSNRSYHMMPMTPRMAAMAMAMGMAARMGGMGMGGGRMGMAPSGGGSGS